MAKEEDSNLKLQQTIAQLPQESSGDKIMQAVVMTVGPGTRMLELTRSGPAREGITAWVEDERVVWLTTDRSALMPVVPGVLIVTFEVRGTAGGSWRLWASRPTNADGSSSGTLPASGWMAGELEIQVP